MGVKLSEWRIKVIDGGVASVFDKLNGLADKAGGKMGGLQAKVEQFGAGVKSAASEVPGLNSAISLVTNPYTAIAAGILAVGAAAVKGTGMAMDFEKGMSQINTTARLSRPELDALRQKLLDTGATSTVPLQEIPKAFNQIISAVCDSKKALEIFGPALKASQAGFTDINTIADATTNVMGAVGKATPTEVFDALFATVRLGKGEFKDFAEYLPKVIPIANNVGIKYQEIAGAFALMTGKGQGAAEASTLLSNAMTALAHSDIIYGSKSKKGFIDSGIAIFDHAGKMRNLVDIVADLSKKTQGLTDKQRQSFLAGIGLDAQAASAFSVLAQNSAEYSEFTKGVTNSAGEMQAAYERSLSPATKLTLLGQQYDKLLTEVGYKILPYVNRALEWGLGFVEKIKANSEPISNYFLAAVAPVRLLWAGLKGTYNVLEWISDKLGGGTMGNLLQGLFGGSGELWPQVKSFLNNFYQAINVLMSALDDASEGRFRDAANRFTDFQAKLRAEESMKSYDPAKASNFLQQIGQGQQYMQGPAYKLPYTPGGGGALKSLTKGTGDKPKGPAKPSGLEAGIKSVNDGGRQVRNVTVNIGALMKDLHIHAATVKEGAADLEKTLIEMIIRAVSGAEQALSN